MIKAVRTASILFIFLISLYLAHSFPRQAKFPCSPTTALILKIQTLGYSYLATGERFNSSAVSIYIKKDTGHWLIISHDFDQNSCITDYGAGWSWALGITPL